MRRPSSPASAVANWAALALPVAVLAVALGGAPMRWAPWRSSIAAVVLVTFVAGLPWVLLTSLRSDPLDVFAKLLVGGEARGGPKRWAWLLLFPVLGALGAWFASRSLTGSVDLPEEVAKTVGVLLAVGGGWLLHQIAGRFPGVPRLGPAVFSGGLAVAAFWLWRGPVQLLAAAWSPALFVLVLLCAGLAVALALRGRGASRLRWVFAALSLGAVGDALLGPVEVAGHTLAGRDALRAAWFFADADGDGFAGRLGGADCDDDDPSISPLAVEIVGNGRDENCRAGDLAETPAIPNSTPIAGSIRPDVVLISVDALRADALTPELMPNLWQFAESGRRFTRAHAAAPFTDLSLRSTFTGWPPSDYDHQGRVIGMDRTLADLLASAGWQTFALHPLHHLGELVTLGFQRMNNSASRLHPGRDGSSAPAITKMALQLLGRPSADPRLLWVHYLEPHHLYIPHAGFEHLGDDFIGRYRQEVAFVDQEMAPLFAWLSRPEVAARTVVVLFSDHGEYLGEQNRKGHDYTLFEPVTHVPLVVWAPGVDAGIADNLVGLVDLLPTVLDLANISGVEPRAGRSLLDPAPERRLLGEARRDSGAYQNLATVSLRQGNHLLHCDELDQICGLYDVDVDKTCAHDVSADLPEVARALRQALDLQLETYRNDGRHALRRASFAARWQKPTH